MRVSPDACLYLLVTMRYTYLPLHMNVGMYVCMYVCMYVVSDSLRYLPLHGGRPTMPALRDRRIRAGRQSKAHLHTYIHMLTYIHSCIHTYICIEWIHKY